MKEWVRAVNLYYMLCYAWDRLDQTDLVDASLAGENEQVTELLARVLKSAVADILRRGIDRGYVPHVEDLCGVRGRVELSTASGQLLLRQAKARCLTDEFSADIAANRRLRYWLRQLARTPTVATSLRSELSYFDRMLRDAGVSETKASGTDRIVFHRNNRQYQFALAVCELIANCHLVDEAFGHIRFVGFSRAKGMEMLFQWFVRRFFEREVIYATVSAPTSRWAPSTGNPSDLGLLPELRTDMLIRWPDRWLIVDTKFTDKSLVADWRSGAKRLNAGHLYQIYAYVRTFSLRADAPDSVEGMLLYPEVDQPLTIDVEIHGHRMRVCTVNLAQSWIGVRERLLALAS